MKSALFLYTLLTCLSAEAYSAECNFLTDAAMKLAPVERLKYVDEWEAKCKVDGESAYSRAMALYQLGDKDAALMVLEPILSDTKIEHRFSPILLYAQIVFRKGDNRLAINIASKLNASNPGDSDVVVLLARANILADSYSDAKLYAGEAVKNGWQLPVTYPIKIAAQYNLAEFPDVISSYEGALSAGLEDESLFNSSIVGKQVAHSYIKIGKYEQSASVLRSSFKLHPELKSDDWVVMAVELLRNKGVLHI